MPINITEEFVRNLMEQNAALITQVANLSATVDSLQQTIKELQEQLNKNSKKSHRLIRIKAFAVKVKRSRVHRMDTMVCIFLSLQIRMR